jgi:two-component system response regulator AtoC
MHSRLPDLVDEPQVGSRTGAESGMLEPCRGAGVEHRAADHVPIPLSSPVPMATILCVDDEPSVGELLEHSLARVGHRPLLVSSVGAALQEVRRAPLDLIIADYRMAKLDGSDLLALLDEEGHRVPVLLMTGHLDLEHAVISIRSGAIDYLTKPLRAEAVEIAVQRALEVARLRRENESFRREMLRTRSTRSLIGESEPFLRTMQIIGEAAPTSATVLLQGEPGTGKEVLARALHDLSARRDAPFIVFNCAAMPEGLVESALFGVEKGAVTRTVTGVAGALERAHTGTLLLDEVSEIGPELQARLLRVLQEHELVAGTRPMELDVRLVATTTRDPGSDGGKLRNSLHDRLNVVSLRVPTLRERVEDVPRLVHHFVRRLAEHEGTSAPAIASETIQLLQRYSWPGNVRELRNAVERAVMLNRDAVLRPSAFDERLRELRPDAESMPFSLDELERRAIKRALEATGGNRTRAAKLLGICERTLRNKLNTPRVEEAREA